MDLRKSYTALVAVGSQSNRICSIGAFARAEAEALKAEFGQVLLLEPTSENEYPTCANISHTPDFIFFHAPSLHDRLVPWGAIRNALKLRRKFPGSKLVSIVHEYTEAPWHWKLRQKILLKLSHFVIANTEADFLSVSSQHPRVLRSQLGPTLALPQLQQASQQEFANVIIDARQRLAGVFNLDLNQKWILHPGLVTQGKGVDSLHKIIPTLSNEILIIMGGLGPKPKDHAFALLTVTSLKKQLGERGFKFIENPPDEIYRQMLLASDLVLLPYDAGCSERRSSFLSAMSCGANVWTTTGAFTKPMKLEQSGVHHTSATAWKDSDSSVLAVITQALQEPLEQCLERRQKNLAWAKSYSWQSRVEAIRKFLTSEA